MVSSIDSFKSALADVVKNTTLNEKFWALESWKGLWENINQSILEDASKQHALVASIFSKLGNISARNCKSLARVQKKMTEQRAGRENYFKVISDFVAIRVHCEVSEIQSKIDHIREIVLGKNGVLHIRGSSEERQYGFFMDPERTYTDITQYVYVYLKEIGYPLEVQIGHEFASHTFTIDSELRDNPSCGKTDLWNGDFYGDVKSHILDKANGVSPKVSTEQIHEKALKMHENNVPKDLRSILSKI